MPCWRRMGRGKCTIPRPGLLALPPGQPSLKEVSRLLMPRFLPGVSLDSGSRQCRKALPLPSVLPAPPPVPPLVRSAAVALSTGWGLGWGRHRGCLFLSRGRLNPSGGSDLLKITQRGGLEPASPDSQMGTLDSCCSVLPGFNLLPRPCPRGSGAQVPCAASCTPVSPALLLDQVLGSLGAPARPVFSVSCTSFSFGFPSTPLLLASSGCVHFSCFVCLVGWFVFFHSYI